MIKNTNKDQKRKKVFFTIKYTSQKMYQLFNKNDVFETVTLNI